MKKNLLSITLASIVYLASFVLGHGQTNPIAAANNFNVLTEGNLTISQGDIEGAIGIGGNFIVSGNSQRTSANATGGTSFVTLGGINYAMVVRGDLANGTSGTNFKIDGKSGVTNSHFVRFNAISGDTWQQNASTGVRTIDIGVSPLSTVANRRITINSTTQDMSTISNSTSIYDFNTSFSSFRTSSNSIKSCTQTGLTVTNSGGNATVNLTGTGARVWNLDASTYNNFNSINLTGTLPSASNPLYINVDVSGVTSLDNLKLIMGSESDNFMEINRAPFILWNFHKSSTTAQSVTFTNASLFLGSILAPDIDLIFSNNGNITGQIIGKTVNKTTAGEFHIAKFNSTVTCSTTTTVDCNCNGTNLIVNPSFEPGVASWWTWGNLNFFRSSAYPKCGSFHAEMYNYAAKNTYGNYAGFGQTITTGFTPGDQFNFSAFAGVHDASQDAVIEVDFRNATSSIVKHIVGQIDAILPTMNRYTLSGTIPVGTTQIIVQAYANADYIKSDQWCFTATTVCQGTISSFRIEDLTGAGAHTAIANNGTYNINTLPSSFSLEALTTGTVGSVEFTVTGATTGTNVENVSPYNFPSTGIPFTFGPGTYTVTARLYTAANKGGALCDTETITFTLTECTTLPLPTGSVTCANPVNTNPNLETSSTTVFNDRIGGIPASFIASSGNNIGVGNTAFPTGYGYGDGQGEDKATFKGFYYLNTPTNKLLWGKGNNICWGFPNNVINLKNCTRYRMFFDVAGWTPRSVGGTPDGTTDFKVEGKFGAIGEVWFNKTFQVVSSTNCNNVTWTKIMVEFSTPNTVNVSGQPMSLFITTADVNDGLLLDNIYVCEQGATSTLTAIPGVCSNQTHSVTGAFTFTNNETIPTTGTVTISIAGVGSQVFNAPFTSPLSYSISGVPADGQTRTVTATFSNAQGCNASATFVSNTTPATPAFTVSQPACAGGTGSVTITAVAGLTYSFNNGPFNSTLTYNNLAAGSTHNIRAQSSSGCISNAATFTINNPAAIVLSTTQVNVICNGGATGSIDLTVSGGTGAYTYTWSDGSVATQDRTGLAAGSYTVTVRDANNCTKTTTVTITQASVINISASQTNPTCFGAATGSITVSATGGSGSYTYDLGTGIFGTATTRTAVAAGTYTVVVKDANGCTKSTTVTITQPSALSLSTTPTNVLCFGGNNGAINLAVTGGTGSYTFNWGAGQPATQNRTGLTAGTYNVIVTDGNGCNASTSATITQPTDIVLSFTKTDVNCFGGSNGAVDLSVTGGTGSYTYTWSDGTVSTQDRSMLSAGTYTVTVKDANNCTKSISITITQPNDLVLSTQPTNILCFGATTGAVNLTVTGGTAPYSFNWNNGAFTTEDLTNRPAGTYSVIVTDSKGCQKTTSVTLTQPTDLTLTSTKIDVSCNAGNNGSINLTVTGGVAPYSFNWGTNQPTTEDRTGLTAGTYTVIVTDANGCQKTTSITIAQPLAIQLTTTKVDVKCNADLTGSINLSVSGGTSPYTYNWGLNQPTTEDRSNLAAGTYSVIVTDSKGCTAQTSVTILQPSALVLTPSSTNITCFGANNGTINITAAGGVAPYSYNWGLNQPTTASRSNLAPGTYSVTVTDANGCIKTASVTITQPTEISLSTTQVNVLCNGGATGSIDLTVTGGTGSYTFNWGANQPTTQNRTGLTAGIYTVIVTDANGCTKTTSVTITQPVALTATATPVAVKCFAGNDGSITLTVNGGVSPYTFDWGAGQPTTQNRTGLTSGTYNLTVTDANNCKISTTATITQPSELILSFTKVDLNCNGGNNGSIDLTVNGGIAPYTYTWSDGNTATQDRTNLVAGTYTVIVKDANNCTKQITITITQPDLLVLSTQQTNILCNEATTGAINLTVVGGTSPYTYSWNSGAFTTEDLTNLAAGVYSVVVTDSKGCQKTTSVTLTQPTILALSTTKVDISCNAGADGSINLTVTGGISPYTYNWDNGQATTEDRSGLTAGTYTVVVTDANGCQKTIAVTINQPSALTKSLTQANVTCFGGNNGSVNLSVSGGTPSYTFLWNNGATTEDLNNLVAGNYSVTITDAKGCTTIISTEITQPTQLVATPSKTDVSCFGGMDGTANLIVSGGTSPYTFVWSNNTTTQNQANLALGTYNVTVRDANQCTTTASVTITQPTALSASTSGTNVSCFGGNNGTINLTINGGTQPYTYLWNNGATTKDLANLQAGTYTVTVRDFKNCITTASYIITQPTALNLSYVNTEVTCFGDANASINLSVTGGTAPYTFKWRTANNSQFSTNEDISNLAAGTYIVNVKDANNCEKELSVTITQPNELSLSFTKVDVTCNGAATGSIDLNVVGGTAPYTYFWSNNANTQDLSNLSGGNYTVIVTDANFCQKSITVTINQNSNIVINGSSTNLSCFNIPTGTITIGSVNGGVSPFTYTWSDGPTTQNRTNLPAGTYTLTVRDSQGCTNSKEFIITQPTEIAVVGNPSNVKCFGESSGAIILTSVTGGTGSYTYSWKNSSNIVVGMASTLSNVPAGTYTVTITDSNGCTKTANFTVNQPVIINATLSQTDVSCFNGENGAINLSVTGGVSPYSYLWSNGSTTEDISGLKAGMYTVTVTDANMCTYQVATTIAQPSELVLTPSKTDITCFGLNNGTASVSVQGGTMAYSYLWSNGSTESAISNLAPGVYDVTVTDSKNCQKTVSITIIQPNILTLSIAKTDLTCFNIPTGTIDLTVSGGTAPYSYLWNNNAMVEDLNNLAAGMYSVTVTDTKGCTSNINTTLTQPQPSSIGNFVWVDTNANGEQDAGETGLAGVAVKLFNANSDGTPNGASIANTTTAMDGSYNFPNVCPGNYVIEFGITGDYKRTLQKNNVSKDATDSDANPQTGFTNLITIAPGETDNTNDAGYYLPASLGDFVWEDKNADGDQDTNEFGIEGAIVSLIGTTGSGNVVNQSTTTGSNGEYAFNNLIPGTYTVIFTKPTGFNFASPKDQSTDSKDSDADLITGIAPSVTLASGDQNNTIDAGFYMPASLGNYVWEDKNANGIQESDELPIANVTVSLTDEAGNQARDVNNNLIPSTTTNGSGNYTFTNLKPGIAYVVVFTKPTAYETTKPNNTADLADSDADLLTGKTAAVVLTSGENNTSIDAGYYILANIGDYVWDDKNANGVQDGGEPGIENVTVTLTGTDGTGLTVSKTTTTNANGIYNFLNLVPGNYVVTFSTPTDYKASPKDNAGNEIADSDASVITGATDAIILVSGETNNTIDAGFYKTASLGNYVWEDINANGEQDEVNTGIAGVIVSLVDEFGNFAKDNDNNTIATVTTSATGFYSFSNLKPGVTYIVKFEAPIGFAPTRANIGNDLTDSDANIITGLSQQIILASGENNLSIDAGYYKAGSIGDYVWEDKNANGAQDLGEIGIANATVKLTGVDAAGNPVSKQTLTDGNGAYLFDDLAPGTYQVEFIKPSGFTYTTAQNNTTDDKDSDADIATGLVSNIVLLSGQNILTIDAGYYNPASLGDYVWEDKNANGIQDMDEPAIAMVQASLKDAMGNVAKDANGNNISNTTTDANGLYSFTNLKPGVNYVVEFVAPSGFIFTNANFTTDDAKDSDASTITGSAPSVTLQSGENNPTIDAGLFKPATLGDFVWEDKNANGIQDSNESGLPNITVTLNGTDGFGNTVNKTVITGIDGKYIFNNLVPGNYTVTFSKPSGYTVSPSNNTSDDEKDSDINNLGVSPLITLQSGDNNLSIDAGLYRAASLGDYVWEDINGNGVQDLSEPVISNVTVSLEDATGNIAKDNDGNMVTPTTSNSSGLYSFSNLKPGVEYVVKFTTPAGYTITAQDATSDIADSDIDKLSGKSAQITLASGENNTTIDAGFYKPAELGDFVFHDINANGVQDTGEPGIIGATVNLTGIDAANNNITATTTTDGTGKYLFEGLAPGNYTVIFVKPMGYEKATITNIGDDSKDSDANQNTGVAPTVTLLSGDSNKTIDAGYYNPASLGDYVWVDTNGNGIQDGSEIGLAGVIVTLQGTDNQGNPVSTTTTTDINGAYSFTNLIPGSYSVIFSKPAGYNPTPANTGTDTDDSDASELNGQTQTVILNSGENNTTLDAGFYLPASIGDYVWNDKNANGIQDADEAGIAGALVTLTGTDGAGNTINKTTTTNSDGLYSFIGLAPGTYTVIFSKPSGYDAASPQDNTTDELDSDANTITGTTLAITLTSGQVNTTIDAGFFKPASLGNYTWIDTNGNGKQDIGELPLAGVKVYLEDINGNPALDFNNMPIASKSTDINGNYSFVNLKPATTYVVRFEAPLSYNITGIDKAVDDLDSDANPTTGKTTSIILASGESNQTIDAGFYLPAKLGDYVWEDANGNGVQDNGENPIAGVSVNLTATLGDGTSFTASTTTNTNGLYEFTNLAPGSYTVTFIKPTGYVLTALDKGGIDTKDSDADLVTGSTASITLNSGDDINTIDAGLYKLSSIGDFVWDDTNVNGVQDPGEPGIKDVFVTLIGTDGLGNSVNITQQTDVNGAYNFTDLLPGTYNVIFTRPNGYSSTTANTGSDLADSDADKITGLSPIVVLNSGTTNNTIDAGFYRLASIGNYVWFDLNQNGIQDNRIDANNGNPIVLGPELPARNIVIELYKSDNTFIGTRTTNANGFYSFTDLEPGDYYLKFDPRSYPHPDFVISNNDQGSNDETDSDFARVTYRTINTTLTSGEEDLTWDLGLYRNSDPEITDPCGCLEEYIYSPPVQENYIYTETVEVSATPGGVWRIVPELPSDPTVKTYGIMLDGPSADFIPELVANPSGLALTEVSQGPGLSTYRFNFYHQEPLGYQIVVSDGVNYLTIKNACESTKEEYDNRIDNLCAFSDPLTLQTEFTNPDGSPLGTAKYYYMQNSEFVFTPNFNEYTLVQAALANPPMTEIDPKNYAPGSTVALYIQWTPAPGLPKGGSCPKTLVLNVKIDNLNPACVAAIGDRVWEDVNGDGFQDAGDANLAGVTVTLYDENGLQVTKDAEGNNIFPVITSTDGAYKFEKLIPGSYKVRFSSLVNYERTMSNKDNNIASNDLIDNDADVTGDTQVYQLTAGQYNNTVDAGYKKIVSLPLNLLSFKAKAGDKETLLDWRTANESDFSHFEIERSLNAREFTQIGKVYGANKSVYNFKDNNPVVGENFYRLKMVDMNGTYKYSNIASVVFDNNTIFANVENPVQNGEIKLTTNADQRNIRLYNTLGQPVNYQIISKGNNSYMLKLSGIETGVYVLQVLDGTKTIHKKLVLR